MSADPRLSIRLEDAGDPALFSLVGGKAANLGAMIKAGLPVPEGFCVTTEAYAGAAERVGLAEPISRLGAEPTSRLGDGLDRGLGEIRAALLSVKLEPALEASIREAYASLDRSPVAVRSSATAEDLLGASFAGAQDTFLNVIGIEGVLDAVRSCWASLWSARAFAYRASSGIDPLAARIAVVVQNMIRAEVSGVLFTANPLTGNRWEMALDASYGLGEAIVSGMVNPDHFVVRRPSEEIVERRSGDKLVRVAPLEEGGTAAIDRTEASRSTSGTAEDYCLSDAQVRSIARIGGEVERLFGSPQDVEWAIDGEAELWLTQARAITTLFPLPDGSPSEDGDLRLYYSMNASQGMESPFTPMGESLFRLLVSGVTALLGFPQADPVAGPDFLREAGGRLFLDVTSALRDRFGRPILKAMTGAAEARVGASIETLAADPRFALIPRSPIAFVSKAASFLFRSRIPWYAMQSLASPKAAARRIRSLPERLEALARVPPDSDFAPRMKALERIFAKGTLAHLITIMPGTVLVGEALAGAAKKLLGDLAAPGEFEEALRALPNNATTEMNRSLWELSREIPERHASFIIDTAPERLAELHREGSFPSELARAFSAFLERFGHRCAAELDGGLPRWSENPIPVFSIVANYLKAKDTEPRNISLFREKAALARDKADELIRRARSEGALKGRAVSFCLRRARQLLGFRETPREYIGLMLGLARRLLLPLGRRLAEEGFLAQPADIFFLRIPELEKPRVENYRALVEERKQLYAANGRIHAPALILSDGTQPIETGSPAQTGSPARAGEMRGLAASSGIVSGRARVLFDPSGAKLEPGEILVAPSTDPGWTPLFLSAAGLVMENGGPMSHGAIVAREYGIPAVVAVVGATVLIRTGMILTIDGGQGTVTINNN